MQSTAVKKYSVVLRNFVEFDCTFQVDALIQSVEKLTSFKRDEAGPLERWCGLYNYIYLINMSEKCMREKFPSQFIFITLIFFVFVFC